MDAAVSKAAVVEVKASPGSSRTHKSALVLQHGNKTERRETAFLEEKSGYRRHRVSL